MSLDQRTGRGPKDQIASKTLLDNREHILPQAVALRDDLYCLRGINICNTQLVSTPKGFVVVDTGRSSADGEAILQLAAEISGDPIIAVIYTHSHYTLGTGPIMDKYPDIPIIAHHKVHENISDAISADRRFMSHRARMESARYLPSEGPDADFPGSKIFTPGTMSYVRPTWEINNDEETIELGGVPFTIHTTYPFDTDDTILIWLSDRDAILHNHFADNFPNVYPIQGGRYRDPLPWLAGIDRMRLYDPEYVLSTHGAPSSGKTTCRRRLTEMRDALQFVHDQTIRGMNKHLLPDELVDFVTLPNQLAESPHLRQTYGIAANHVRGVYGGRAGWFDGDATSIYPPSPDDRAHYLVRDLGGRDAAVAKLRSAIEASEYRWASELGRSFYRAYPDDPEVCSLYAEVLRCFGHHTTAWTIRNYYLSQARIVEGRLIREDPERSVDDTIALMTAPGTFVRAMAYRVDPSRMPETPAILDVRFAGVEFACRLVLRNGIAEYIENPSKTPDSIDMKQYAVHSITCSRTQWISYADSLKPFSGIVEETEVTCSPSADAVRALLDVFD